MNFELKPFRAWCALLVLALVLICPRSATSTTIETLEQQHGQADGTVFLQATKGNFWNGDCSSTGLCTQDSPCSVSGAELIVNSSVSCSIVFTSGTYGELKVSSTNALTYRFIGRVNSLNLTTHATSITYSSIESGIPTATLQESLLTVVLEGDQSTSLTVDALGLSASHILITSQSAFMGAVDIKFIDSSFSSYDFPGSSLPLIDIVVPSGSSTGASSFSMERSNVVLSRGLVRHSLLRSRLGFGRINLSKFTSLGSPLSFFKVPSQGLSSIIISNTSIANLDTLIEPVQGDGKILNDSFRNVSLFISESQLIGAPIAVGKGKTDSQNTIEQSPPWTFSSGLPSINPSSCVNLHVSSSQLSHLNLNCYNSTQQGCKLRLEDSSLSQNLLCVFDSPTAYSNATFINTTIKTNDMIAGSLEEARTRFRDADIDAQNLTFLTQGGPVLGTSILEGRVRFSPKSYIAADSISLTAAHVQIPRLKMNRGEIMFINGPVPSVLEPLPNAPSSWTWETPINFRRKGTHPLNDTVDLTKLDEFIVLYTKEAAMTYAYAIGGSSLILKSFNQTSLMERMQVLWTSELYVPLPRSSYSLGEFYFPNGVTVTEKMLPVQNERNWQFRETVKPSTLCTGVSDIELVMSLLTNSPAANTPQSSSCGSSAPNPGNWTCEAGKWVHKTALNVSGNLVVPAHSTCVVHGSLVVSGNIVFFDSVTTLTSLQCITLTSNLSKILFNLTLDSSIPVGSGTRKNRSWQGSVLFEAERCPGALNNMKVHVNNAPSCRKIQASPFKNTSPHKLSIQFSADFNICNTTYIVIGCSSGAILLLVLLGALIWCCCHNIQRPGYERLPTRPLKRSIQDDEEDLPSWND